MLHYCETLVNGAYTLNVIMDKKDLLKEIMHFNDEMCNCKVVLKDNHIFSEYKSESKSCIDSLNLLFSELGFEYIRMRKYADDDEDNGRYMPGTEYISLLYLINNVSYRFETYKTIRKKICKKLSEFTKSEISACLNIAFDILYELDVFTVKLDMIFDITDDQRKMFLSENIYQYNSMFIPYILKELQAYKAEIMFYNQKFWNQLYDYLFSMYYEISPLEQVIFGESCKNGKIVYGLKLKEKDVTLADFLEMLCCDEIVDILYKKSYGKDKSYLTESLKFVYYLALGLETIISE